MDELNREPEPSYLKYLQDGIKYIQEHPEQAAVAGLVGLWLFEDSENQSKYDLQVVIWDVEHGGSMFINSPEGNILVDLGRHQNGFSPTDYLNDNGVDNIDWLIISHPDKDHIRDIAIFDNRFDISLYTRPDGAAKYIRHRKRTSIPMIDSIRTLLASFWNLKISDIITTNHR